MFLDTSAVVEALIAGPEADRIAEKLKLSSTPLATFPTVIYEVSVVIASKPTIPV
jgi:ribonuclease VapC